MINKKTSSKSKICSWSIKPMHKRLGNAGSCVFCGAVCVAGCIIRWITMDQNFVIFVAAMIILGFGSGMVGSVFHTVYFGFLHLRKTKRWRRQSGHDNGSIYILSRN